MPEQVNVTRAELRELKPDGQEGRHRVTVQFNPETLKVSFTNQVVPPGNTAGAQDQSGTASTQFVGKGTTKMSVQLWFDVTGEQVPSRPDSRPVRDVRDLTGDVIYFITPQQSEQDRTKYLPPGIRFLWGSFQFDGIVEGLEESLEFFSAEGRPLRASVTLNMSQQKIEVLRRQGAASGAPGAQDGEAPGTRPLAQASAGATVQGMAALQGQGANWQEIAAANKIENPRLLRPGQLLDMNVSVGPRR